MTECCTGDNTPTADEIKFALAAKGFTDVEILQIQKLIVQFGGPKNALLAIETLDQLDKAA